MADITTGNPKVDAALATCEGYLADAIAHDARIGWTMTPVEESVATVAALAHMEDADPYYSAHTIFGMGALAGTNAILAMRRSTADVFIYTVAQCRQYGLTRDLQFVVRIADDTSPWKDNSKNPIPGAFYPPVVEKHTRYWRKVAKAYFADFPEQEQQVRQVVEPESPVLVDGLYPVRLSDVLSRGTVKAYGHEVPQEVVDACNRYGIRIDRSGLRFGDYLLIAPEAEQQTEQQVEQPAPQPAVEQQVEQPAPQPAVEQQVEPAPAPAPAPQPAEVEPKPLDFGNLFGGSVKVSRRKRK